MRSLGVAATGMMAQQLHVDVISNNIANMTTTGYKRHRPEFQDLLYQDLRRVGASSSADGGVVPAGVQLGLGVKTAAVYRINEQGIMVNTENKLDLAIQGEGFFIVDLPSGESGYSRSGNFQLSPEGALVTADGYPVSPGITVPANTVEVAISPDGMVSAKVDGQADLVEVGQIELAAFVNPAGLEEVGDNILKETPASGDPQTGNPGAEGFGRVLQGYLESSNVNPVQEITALITAQRAYDMNSKVISASDEMMNTVTQMR
ncbi:MAG: flagellar basal-body rod protein FlgG [Geminicoccaceae bacterium]|nr:flagellar basal-body rod protein FlgG [Geminicoccaceae bacterium]